MKLVDPCSVTYSRGEDRWVVALQHALQLLVRRVSPSWKSKIDHICTSAVHLSREWHENYCVLFWPGFVESLLTFELSSFCWPHVLLTARLSLCSPAELTYFKLIPNFINIIILHTVWVDWAPPELPFYSSCTLSHIQQHQIFALQTEIYHQTAHS